jgi:hypothetical protein
MLSHYFISAREVAPYSVRSPLSPAQGVLTEGLRTKGVDPASPSRPSCAMLAQKVPPAGPG